MRSQEERRQKEKYDDGRDAPRRLPVRPEAPDGSAAEPRIHRHDTNEQQDRGRGHRTRDASETGQRRPGCGRHQDQQRNGRKADAPTDPNRPQETQGAEDHGDIEDVGPVGVAQGQVRVSAKGSHRRDHKLRKRRTEADDDEADDERRQPQPTGQTGRSPDEPVRTPRQKPQSAEKEQQSLEEHDVRIHRRLPP